MASSIELMMFDPYSPCAIELGEGDEVLAVDTKIYNTSRKPYLIVRRAKADRVDDDLSIWTVTAHKLSETEPLAPLQMTDRGKLFLIQRISDSGARTGNYASYLAWLIVVDCSGKRKPVTLSVVENGTAPFDCEKYVGTFGKAEKLYNLFAARQG